MILRRTAAAVLSVCCLTLAACSSSDDAAKSTAPTDATSVSKPAETSSSTTAPSSSAGGGSDDLAAIVVQRSEVPSAFTAKPADPDDRSSDAEINACLGIKSTEGDEKETVHSKDFATQTADITSKATRFGSQASVDADVKTFKNPKIKSCFVKQFRKESGSGLGGATFVSADLEVTPGTNGGPSNVVATITGKVVLEANGKQAPVYVNTVYITGPKLEVDITFTSVGTQFDPKLATTVASAVAKRAATA